MGKMNRNCEVFWSGTKERRSLENSHKPTKACIESMRRRPEGNLRLFRR